MQTRFLLMLVLLAVAACGKDEEVPPTFAVTGQVVFTDKSPLKGGTINFLPEGNANFTSIGEIGADGKFTLVLALGKKTVPGAVEGNHTVHVLPPMDDKQQMLAVRVKKPVVRVQARENHFIVEIEKVSD